MRLVDINYINLFYSACLLLLIYFTYWLKIQNKYLKQQLKDKELKTKYCRDINHILNRFEQRQAIEEYIYKIVLDDIGTDSVFYVVRNDLEVGAARKVDDLLLRELSNEKSLAAILNITKNKALFYSNNLSDTNSQDIDFLLNLWPNIKKKYPSFCLYPIFAGNEIIGIIAAFNKKPNYFNQLNINEISQTIDKMKIILKNIYLKPINSLVTDFSKVTSEDVSLPKMADLICLLINKMFHIEASSIALIDENSKKLKVYDVSGQKDEQISSFINPKNKYIRQVVNNGQTINLTVNDLKKEDNFLNEDIGNLLCVPIFCKSEIKGLICVINKYSLKTNKLIDFNQEDECILLSLAEQIGTFLENNQLYTQFKNTLVTTIKVLANALEARDPYTKGHSEKVAEYALLIGKELKFTDAQLQNLYFAGVLHDIGKIGVSENILRKPGKLTPEEYAQMKLHPYIGQQILRPVSFFQNLLPAVYHHHEHWNGNGYPDGLKQEQIPLEARILTVADAFEAIISNRVYRNAEAKERAIDELIKNAGKQFDPQVVDAFLTAMDKLELSKEGISQWKIDTVRNIYRDVIMAVTDGSLVLVDTNELTDIIKDGRVELDLPITKNSDVPLARTKVHKFLKGLGLSPNRQKQILLCVSEVISNILKHAKNGKLIILATDKKMWIVGKDTGVGIKLRDIPKATLQKGYSTKKSLGYGFAILLEMSHTIYLETNEAGTTVILEEDISSGVK